MTDTDTATSGATLPLTVFDLIVDDPQQRIRIRDLAVDFGATREIPLEAIATIDPELPQTAADFYFAARNLWDLHHRGEAVGVDAVLVRVPLIDVRQSDSKDGRVDLTGECRALEHMAETSDVATLLDATPRWSVLRKAGTVTRVKDRTIFTGTVTAERWPIELGGPPCPGELRREILLEVSHAAWRDRRSRRLIRCATVAMEVWPDPDPYRGRLTPRGENDPDLSPDETAGYADAASGTT